MKWHSASARQHGPSTSLDPGLAALEGQLGADPAVAAHLAQTGKRRPVGLFLAALRAAARITSTSLADRLGWKQSQVSRLEGAAGGLPRLDTLVAFASGCGADLALVARDAEGVAHVCSLTSDSFGEEVKGLLRPGPPHAQGMAVARADQRVKRRKTA